jgi:hypothetical protein
MFTKIIGDITKFIDGAAAAISVDLIIIGILGCAVLIGVVRLLLTCFKFKKTYRAIAENASVTYLKEVLTKKPFGLVKFFAVLIFWLSALLLVSLYSSLNATISSLTAVMLILSAYSLIYGIFALLSKLILKAKYKKINILYGQYAQATDAGSVRPATAKASKNAAAPKAVGSKADAVEENVSAELKSNEQAATPKTDEQVEEIIDTMLEKTIENETAVETIEDKAEAEAIEKTTVDEPEATIEKTDGQAKNQAQKNRTDEVGQFESESGGYEPYVSLRQPRPAERRQQPARPVAKPTAAPQYVVEKAASYVTPTPASVPAPVPAPDINNLNGLDTSDDIIARIRQIKFEGASIQTMQSIALLIQREREKKENKTLEQQRRMNEALSDLLKTMSRYK